MIVEHLAHDLFLLMLTLSQLKSEARILPVFLDAMNSTPTNIHLRLLPKGEQVSTEVIEIATTNNTFGYIALEENLNGQSKEIVSLIRNAIRMLAIILEKRMQEMLLEDENLRLEAAVTNRTSELLRVNEQLKSEIAERKQAEDALRASKDQFETAITHAPIPMVVTDANQDIILFNDKFIEQFGYTLEDVSMAEEWWLIAYPDETYRQKVQNSWAKAIARATESGTEIEIQEWDLTIKDRSIRRVEFKMMPLGEISIITMNDITERKRAEKAQEKRIVALTRPLDDTVGVAFEELFNLDDIQRLQNDFSQATGVASIITNTDGTPITAPSNFCRLCNDIIRKTDKGMENCFKSDAVIGRANSDSPVIQPCMSGGLWDAGTSISVGGRHIANWLIGQVRDETQTEEKIRAYAREIEADEEAVVEAFREVPAMSREQFGQVAQAVFTLAQQLSTIAYQNVQQARFITERKQAEKALRESEEKLSTLFESMTEMVALHDVVLDDQGEAVDYRITDCNRAYTRITGIPREDAIGNLATEVYQTEIAPYLEKYTRVGQTGVPYEFTVHYPPMDKHFMISVVSPRKGQFATITTDITALKQIEAIVSAKNKELENYLYVASHDLRSPLVNIQGFSQRLQKQTNTIKQALTECSLDSETHRQIETIINKGVPKSLSFIFTNVAKMDNLINGLLQISRTGRVRMVIREIDMNALLKSITHALAFQIEQTEAQIVIEDLPACCGDEELLNQLFANIIGNAIKYRDIARSLTVTIGGETQYNKAVYRIEDTGIGMEARHLEKIWDVFYRIDAGSPEAGEGIGLSIVKRIVDKHKGRVRVESEAGKGTVFYIELQRNEFAE